MTVTVTGGVTWTAAPAGAEEWIHIAPAEGKFTVTVDDNPESLERSGYINVSPGDKTLATCRIYVTQEPKAVPASITPQLPEGTTPEEGLTVPFTAGMSVLPVTVAPENAQWSVRVEADGTTDPAWLSATNVVAPRSTPYTMPIRSMKRKRHARPTSSSRMRTTAWNPSG